MKRRRIETRRRLIAMTTLDFESDRFLTLLTDALRAGPGSPQWHQAVERLQSTDATDEYRLLVTAREHLESGKSYRSLRAGPGFTRKVLDGIRAETKLGSSGSPGRFSAATMIAVASAVVGIAAIGIIVYLLSTGGEKPARSGVDDLAVQTFGHIAGGPIKFEKSLPSGWSPIGLLALKADKNGLHVLPQNKGSDQGGGGIYRTLSLDPSQPWQIDMEVHYTSGAGIVPEIFVTDQPTFNDNHSGTSPHELLWTVLDDRPQVQLPDHAFEPAGAVVQGQKNAILPVKIRFDGQYAIVETGGRFQGKWEGPHQLSPDLPRYIGIRFLVRGGQSERDVTVESYQLSKP
jgi:hypothetical protein